MTAEYMDELVIYEYGNYTDDELHTWLTLWNNWFKSD